MSPEPLAKTVSINKSCCKTRFDSRKSLLLLHYTAETTHFISFVGVAFPFLGLLSFLFLEFKSSAKISVAVKSGYTGLSHSN